MLCRHISNQLQPNIVVIYKRDKHNLIIKKRDAITIEPASLHVQNKMKSRIKY